MQMAAEGAVEVGPAPGSLAVNDSYTAIVEGRGAKGVDNNFFLVNVPIGNCETQTFVNKFPRVCMRACVCVRGVCRGPACVRTCILS